MCIRDRIYAIPWDDAADGGEDSDPATLNASDESGTYFYGVSAYYSLSLIHIILANAMGPATAVQVDRNTMTLQFDPNGADADFIRTVPIEFSNDNGISYSPVPTDGWTYAKTEMCIRDRSRMCRCRFSRRLSMRNITEKVRLRIKQWSGPSMIRTCCIVRTAGPAVTRQRMQR